MVPVNTRASKAVLGIFLRDDDEAIIHRYFSDDADARYKIDIQENILARLREHNSAVAYHDGRDFRGARTRKASTIQKVSPVHSAPFGKADRFAAGDLV